MNSNMFEDVDYQEELPPEVGGGEKYIEEMLEEHAPETDSRISEAMRKLEKAQLYQTLINNSVFGPNSARPDIQEEVEAELREFAERRLNVLLGISTEAEIKVQALPPQFNEEEAEVLKALAHRALQKKAEVSVPPTPTIKTVSQKPNLPKPTLKRQDPTPEQRPVSQQPKMKTAAKPLAKKPAQPAPHRNRRTATPPPSENVGEKSGVNYAQAGNPRAIPMPSPAAMNAHIAGKANEGMSKMNGTGNDVGNLLMIAARMSQKNNANVVEEE
jgi:hypothetical protein